MLSSSVVITTCERREALARAILSVARQSQPPSEIIIVDDCSSYDVPSALATLDIGNIPVRVSVLPSRVGAPVARNLGASMASGDILMFLDDDDQWAPGKIGRQLAALEAHAEAGWVYTGTVAVDQISDEIISLSRNHESGRVWPNILFRNFVGPTSAVAIRRHIFEQAGGFDPELPALQDYDLWLRLAMIAPVRYDDGHDLLFTSRSLDESARISTKTGNYARAYGLLEFKYRNQLRSLTAKQQRRCLANSYLLQMGKLIRAREVGRALALLVRASFIEPRTLLRIGSSLVSRLRGASRSISAIRPPQSYKNRNISFSVIVPVYNRAHCVGAALASALAQDYPPLEVIVIDDGSEDSLQKALIPFGSNVTLLRSPQNLGAAAARNAAIAVARGTHVAFLDSDDTWAPGKLRAQAEFMESNGVDVCCTGFSVGGTPVARPYGESVSLRDLVWGCHVSPGTTLVASREILLRMGAYDTGFRRLEDWDLLLRMAEAGHRIGFLSATFADLEPSQGGAAEAVLNSLMLMRERHLQLLQSASGRLARDFRAGLAFETAGVHARSGRWFAMAMALLHSWLLAPLDYRLFRLILIPKLASRASRLQHRAHDA